MEDSLLLREQRVSPFMVKRFLKAFVRAVKNRNRQHSPSAGKHLQEIPHHIYSFQKDVLQRQPSPQLLRGELNELQRKINLALNQEKYISTIQEQENKILRGMDMPFRAEQRMIEKKLAAVATLDKDFPTPSVPVAFPFPSSAQLPAIIEPTFHQRIIAQVEQQIMAAELYARQFSTQKSVDKSQLQRIKKLIGQYQKKIKQLKKKYAAS